MKMKVHPDLSRRRMLRDLAALSGAGALHATLPAWARSAPDTELTGMNALSGTSFDLDIAAHTQSIAGQASRAILVNGQLPAPLLRWREGDEITLRVTNHLDTATSIHWHGLLLPFYMDGVPGVSFPGIQPGETFTYRFPIRQSGTYWYHSHSGLQEQLGHYGPIVIDPASPDPVSSDREYVVVLSEWTFENPHRVFAKLKKMSDNYNFQQRTVGDFFRDVAANGLRKTINERSMWGEMRMNPADIADVTGATYTYLVNGHAPDDNWTALFRPGEKIRLRIINASAMTIFNVRVPGLPMTVVQADGLNVEPVETDEFQIGVAETYDVIVEPNDGRAYTLFAETNDRSGFARATLASRPELTAPIPPLRPRPTLTMKDMAMDHAGHGATQHAAHRHGAHGSDVAHVSSIETEPQVHEHVAGIGVVGLAAKPLNRLGDRPNGLEDAPHRVLVYTDLRALKPNLDSRRPEREIELHLTGNMERYMWSFDGEKFSDARQALLFRKGERLRLTLVNDTMMSHPIHLHGMFFDVVTAAHDHKPRKHTIVVKPGEKLALELTPEPVGDWAFHCHLLYHMHAGMMRIVSVVDTDC